MMAQTIDRAAKPRSIDQHKRFFAVLDAVLHHWPSTHPFQPENRDHLRAWLLVKAKHCVIQTFHMSDDASEAARLVPIITALMFKKHCWARPAGTTLHVYVPRSIDFKTVSHEEFQTINDDVDGIIRAETGLDPEQLLKEAI